MITLFVTTGQRAPHSGAINGPSGWVGNCPVGEFNCYTRCHNLVTGITPDHTSRRFRCPTATKQTGSAAEQLVEETLVEEIFIDGMCGVYQAMSATRALDLDAAWRLHPQVALRPEAFGALPPGGSAPNGSGRSATCGCSRHAASRSSALVADMA